MRTAVPGARTTVEALDNSNWRMCKRSEDMTAAANEWEEINWPRGAVDIIPIFDCILTEKRYNGDGYDEKEEDIYTVHHQ